MDKIVNNLLSLKFRSFVAEFREESTALWILCFYILIEYIHPQSMYPVLNFIPWGQTSILLCFLSVFVTGSRANGFGVMDKMFIAISVIVIVSGIFAWSPAASLQYWGTYATWVLMYFCIVSILTTPNRMFLFILFFLIINLKLSVHGAKSFAARGFSFTHWGLSGPPGWFNNSGEFAMQMVVVFSMSWSILLASKEYIKSVIRWWLLLILFPVTMALTVIGSSSRGGQIALTVIIFILFLKGKNLLRKALLLTIVLYFSLHFLPAEQVARFDTMGDDQTSQLRIMHWENALEVIKNNPLGIGYYNWRRYYASHFDVIRVEEIHNTVLQAFVELGYPGGILFLVMLLAVFIMNVRTIREMDRLDRAEAGIMAAVARGINLGLLGAFIASLFMSVLFYPTFWVAFALTSALRHISKKLVIEATDPLNKISLSKSSNTSLRRETRRENKRYEKSKLYYR
jgi:O-antigen ligase